MPDISMCFNASCPSNGLCYRFTATPNPYRQSYMEFTLEDDEVNCSHFYPNTETKTCPKCHQINGVHKMSCSHTKATITLNNHK